ncbi:type III secretion system translocon subunit SctE [Labrenzia sp. OB1]|uniref:type III secretion system translocon subunit SctE n=1 Tax=Labrenzia sp. OB1 TaxID=1561204 RepID=UPI0007B22269|nr:type III secretion system translocon subunit SctE [Labrenzia sp. OB1]KZM47357.1 hypothetical protein OA90_26405 [Labrenzia sp. OB1]
MTDVRASDANIGYRQTQQLNKSDKQLFGDYGHDGAARHGLVGQISEDMPDGERKSVTRTYESVMGGLSTLFPKRSGDELDAELASAINKLQEIMGDLLASKLLNDMVKKRALLELKEENYEQIQEKTTQIAEKSEKKSLWGKITSIFSAIGAVAQIALGAVMCVANPAAGIPMIAAGAIGVVLAADSIAEAFTDKGFLPDAAKYTLMGSMLLLSAVSMLRNFVGTLFSKGAALFSKGAEAAQGAAKGAQVAAQGAAKGAQAAQGAAKAAETTQNINHASTVAQSSGNVVSGITQAGEIAGTVATAIYTEQIGEIQQKAGHLRAEDRTLQAYIMVFDDFIEVLLNQISGEDSKWAAMLEAASASMADRGASMAKAQFTG